MMDETTLAPVDDHLILAIDIVSAYVSNNVVPASGLPALIANVRAAVTGLGGARATDESGPAKPTPAQIKKSISDDALISFEDGKPYKTLRRHLTLRGLTPETYRAKWGLPGNYPMTSPAYSAHRSELAKSLGLGQQRRTYAKAGASEAEISSEPVADAASEKPKRVGRPRKAAEASEA